MEIHDWILLVVLVYVILRYIAVRLAVEGLIAYMVKNNYRTPEKDELQKIEIWVVKKHLGLKTDWKDMP